MFTPKVYSKIWSRIRNDYLFWIRIRQGQKDPDLTESDPTGTVSGSERIRIPPTQYELRCPSSLLVNAVDTEMRMRKEIVHCTQLWDTVQIKRVIHKSPQSWKPYRATQLVLKPFDEIHRRSIIVYASYLFWQKRFIPLTMRSAVHVHCPWALLIPS